MEATEAPIAHWFPPLLTERAVWGMYGWQWVGLLAALLVALVASPLIERVVLWLGARLAKLTSSQGDDEALSAGRGPIRLLIAAGLLWGCAYPFRLMPAVNQVIQVVTRSAVIVAIAWFMLRGFRVAAERLGRVSTDPIVAERARSVQTQVAVLRAVFQFAVWVVGAALLLVQFDVVRNVGVSLLASAGIAGLTVGFAAQKSLSSVLAGVQLSITQPVRIGDSVVIDDDFGTVEDITLTYVVVRFWDLRRFVVPISHFLEKPFQNWSRGDGHLVGAVTMDVDYTTDVEAVRARFLQVLEAEGRTLWDGRVARLHVTEASDRTIRLRAIMSAPGPDPIWELRCLVRERLVSYLAQHAQWLARTRTQPHEELAEAAPAAGGTT